MGIFLALKEPIARSGFGVSRSPCQAASLSDGPARAGGLEQLYKQYWHDLCRYLGATFGAGPPEPEDVAQLAFARFAAHENRAEIRDPKSFIWFTARNIVLSERRSMAVRRRRSEDVKEVYAATGGDAFTPERVLVAKEQIAAVSVIVEAMPAKRRRVLMLNVIEGHSFAEIARQMGLSQTAVKKHYARAMIDLDSVLADE